MQPVVVWDTGGSVQRWGFGQIFSTEAASNPVVFSVILDNDKAAFDDEGHAVWAAPAGIPAGWREELNRAAQDVLTNNADPKAALQKAENAFNRIRR